MVKLLLEAGANANAMSTDGITPWDSAQENNFILKGTDVWWQLNDARF